MREPEWTEVDRAELLALAEYRAAQCPACGQSLSDTTTHEEHGPAFRAEHVATCRGCMALIDQKNAVDQGQPSPYRNARRWMVHKIGD